MPGPAERRGHDGARGERVEPAPLEAVEAWLEPLGVRAVRRQDQRAATRSSCGTHLARQLAVLGLARAPRRHVERQEARVGHDRHGTSPSLVTRIFQGPRGVDASIASVTFARGRGVLGLRRTGFAARPGLRESPPPRTRRRSPLPTRRPPGASPRVEPRAHLAQPRSASSSSMSGMAIANRVLTIADLDLLEQLAEGDAVVERDGRRARRGGLFASAREDLTGRHEPARWSPGRSGAARRAGRSRARGQSRARLCGRRSRSGSRRRPSCESPRSGPRRRAIPSGAPAAGSSSRPARASSSTSSMSACPGSSCSRRSMRAPRRLAIALDRRARPLARAAADRRRATSP